MSRGFVKENDQEELPMVPPRADLPEGTTNYVTPNGMKALLQEREFLHNEKEHLDIVDENEVRITVNFINAKLQLLQERIATAHVIDLSKQPLDEIRFGALITLQANDGKKPQQYQIVGVDEANITKGKISFLSPLARLLMHKKVGNRAVLKLGARNRVFEVLNVEYVL